MSASTTERSVTLENGIEYKRRTTSWMTALGGTASHHDYFAGETHLNPRIWSDVVEKIDRALAQLDQSVANIYDDRANQRSDRNVPENFRQVPFNQDPRVHF